MTRPRLLLVIAGLLLAVSSVLLWQFRFEHAGPASRLGIGCDTQGWVLRGQDLFQIDSGGWTLRPAAGPTAAGAEGLLPGLGKPRYLHVAIDARWQDITRKDDRSWWSARVSLGGRRPDGSPVWPEDGDLVNASGSRGWHRAECVFELPADMGEPRLFINHLAATGTFGVRDLTVTPVRERPWTPAAAAGLVVGWLLWAAAMLSGKLGLARRAAASLALVAAGWFLVFPQPHFHARPFPGGFILGREIPAPPAAATPVPPGPPALPRAAAPASAAVAKPALPAAESTYATGIVRLFRKIDHDWRFAHVAAFFGFGLTLFVLAGLRHAWLPAAVLGLFSEIIPNLLLRDFQIDDAVDLAANFSGLALASLLVGIVTRFRQSRKPREN